MKDYKERIVSKDLVVKSALSRLNSLSVDLILFVVDDQQKLLGSVTDGDIRRGLLRGLDLESSITDLMNVSVKYVEKGKYSLSDIHDIRSKVSLLPEVDSQRRIVRLINFNEKRSLLPVDALIMAGGEGTRLKPLTDSIPKPLLKVGSKPILEHNIDQLSYFGIHFVNISIRYLGNQIVNFFGDGRSKGLEIEYLEEDEPLGTIGALAKIREIHNDTILVMNSDILTNIDYEDFYLEFEKRGADMAVVTIPYEVKIPYAVLELNGQSITAFKEKPTYTYYSNGGIYLIKKELVKYIPNDDFFNATDLMEKLIVEKRKVIQYPILEYWLDIGKPDDYDKAQEDIKHIKFQ